MKKINENTGSCNNISFADAAALNADDVYKIVEEQKKTIDLTDDCRGTCDEPKNLTDLRALTPADCAPIFDWIQEKPPSRDYIIKDLIPTDATAVINSQGGVGKSNLVQLMAVCVAAGLNIKPFEVKSPRRVFLLNVEDSADDMWRRFYALNQVYPEISERKHLLRENLMVFPGRGRVSPFMQIVNGVPAETEYGQWFRQTLLNLNPGFAIFDTKSRLYGLDENSNDHAARWWGMFESALRDLEGPCTALVAAHSKKGSNGGSQTDNRGASAFVDNARVNIVLAHISDMEAKKFDVDPLDYFSMSAPKSNYTRRGGKIYFKRLNEGVPQVVDLARERFSDALDEVVEMIDEQHGGRIKKRDLVDRPTGKKIRHKISDNYSINRRTFPALISFGIDTARLTEIKAETGGNPAVMITTRW